MNHPVDRPGTFRGNIVEYALKEMESGAVAVAIRAELTHFFDNGEWVDWIPYTQEAAGDVWIVKKDGSPNKGQVDNLIRFAGWDGDIMSVINQTWEATPCQLAIQEDTYNGQTRKKIAFVNDYNRDPSGSLGGNVDAEKAKQLAMRFGSQLKAIAADVKRNVKQRPNGAPPKPPAMPPRPPQTGEEIPF